MVCEAVLWITKRVMRNPHILVYVDNYFCDPAHSDDYAVSVQTFKPTCASLGVPLSPDKKEGATTSMTFLGIHLDSVLQCLSLPEGKNMRSSSHSKTGLRKKKYRPGPAEPYQ